MERKRRSAVGAVEWRNSDGEGHPPGAAVGLELPSVRFIDFRHTYDQIAEKLADIGVKDSAVNIQTR